MALNPNDTLSNGHYRIIRQLGRGGFGFVYLAEDTLLAEEVAIKELIPALVGDEGWPEMSQLSATLPGGKSRPSLVSRLRPPQI